MTFITDSYRVESVLENVKPGNSEKQVYHNIRSPRVIYVYPCAVHATVCVCAMIFVSCGSWMFS